MFDLIDAMCYVFSDIEGICLFLGISKERISRIIEGSDKVAYELMKQDAAGNKISEGINE